MDSEKEMNEQKKEYLKSYLRARRRAEDILEEIQRMRMDKMFPSVVNDGMPHGSRQTDLSDYAAALDEMIEDLKQERLKRVQRQQEIERRIRQMKDEDEQRVLRLRYIKGMKWEEITMEMGYTWQHTHRIHSKALGNFIM